MHANLELFLTVLLKFSFFTVYENLNRINYTSEVRRGYQGRVLRKSRTYPFIMTTAWSAASVTFIQGALCKTCLVDNLLIRLIRPMSLSVLV